ncbi:MAG: hypothetical protein ACR2LH_09850, partial [Thermoleophilaceae bacterium]
MREQPRVAAARAIGLIALILLGALLGNLLAGPGERGRTAAAEQGLRDAEQRIAQREREARALRGEAGRLAEATRLRRA